MDFKLFTEADIRQIYDTHVLKPPEYLQKYERTPLELNTKNWKWEGCDYPRVCCVLDFSEWIAKHSISHFDSVLATSKDPELEYITYNDIVFAEYKNGQNDLHTLDLDRKSFDFILFSQTLEHLYNPFLAMQRLYAHLKPGGYLFTSVPTLSIPHMTPSHFYGFTPMGLCMLMKSIDFEIVELGYWGNLDYINTMFTHHAWPDYRYLSRNGLISNEVKNAAQAWVLVKKV